MHTLMVRSLFITFVQLSFTNALDSCNYVLPLRIGSYENISGVIINCPDQVKECLKRIQQLQNSLDGIEDLWKNLTVYDEIKRQVPLRRHQLIEIKKFCILINETHLQHKSTVDSYCIRIGHLYKALYLMDQEHLPILQWLEYYFPIIGGAEVVFGMLVNMLIVMIYFQQQDMRTGPNTVILNLAIVDMLLLNINIVMYYIIYRWIPQCTVETLCAVITYIRMVAIALSVYSMVLLSVLRLLATVSTHGGKTHQLLGKRVSVPLMLLLVWILAGVTSIPEYKFYNGNLCELSDTLLAVYMRFICSCLLPLFVIGASSVATSRILRRSVHQLPGELTPEVVRERLARQTGANVIICLVAVFSFTYLPLNIYYILNCYYHYHPDWNLYDFYESVTYHYTFSVQLFIPLNSCLNPVALFIGSRKYRQYFKSYYPSHFKKETYNVANGQKGTERFSTITSQKQRYQTESL